MGTRDRQSWRCSYVVPIDASAEESGLTALAQYLATLAPSRCEVILIDASEPEVFQQHDRILRWAGKHVPSVQRRAAGEIDLVRDAISLAACEKVIVASSESRYHPGEIGRLCELLDRHEVVEPEEFIGPMTWWSGLDAVNLLLLRGVDRSSSAAAGTFAFRRSVCATLCSVLEYQDPSQLRRVMGHGADVLRARDLFVRREPAPLRLWLQRRMRDRSWEGPPGLRAILFAGLLPFVLLLGLIGGSALAGSYAGILAVASVLIAVRGRVGASSYFPTHACLYAPLWVVERSISLYCSLLARLRGRERRETAPPNRHAPAAATNH